MLVIIIIFMYLMGLHSNNTSSLKKVFNYINTTSSINEMAEDNTILLIDNSGSMKNTDPNNLAAVAAAMLIDTLKPNQNMNIITFGDDVKSSYRLKDNPSPQMLKQSLSMLNYKDKNTDMKAGLKEALDQLDEVKGQKRIIVLSDGKEEPKGGMTQTHEDEMLSLIERAYTAKTEIHTIGLSSLADEGMLSKIAYNTGGSYYTCSNTGELFDIFSKIMGEYQGYYTVDKYMSSSEDEKIMQFSSYVDEMVVKIAAVDNRTPKVEVSGNGRVLNPEKYSEKYRIYLIGGGTNTLVNIKTLDNGKNIIIVQMKSKAAINLVDSEGNFQIPNKIPLDIKCRLDLKENIEGLHMDAVVAGKRESLTKNDSAFDFKFQQSTAGQYSIFVTAYDGNNNIITCRNIDINVTDSPPFFYEEDLPKEVIRSKTIPIKLKPIEKLDISEVSGEVTVDYGEDKVNFPLTYKDGFLCADISFKKTGELKLYSCINGVSNNKSFSYYLPKSKINVLETPYIELKSDKNNSIYMINKADELKLWLEGVLLYKDEHISVLDVKGNQIGNFTVKNGQKGEISIRVTPKNETSDLVLYLKGSNEVKLTESINTASKVTSTFKYYLYKFKMALIVSVTLLLIVAAMIIYGWYVYKTKIAKYKTVKDIYYRSNGKIKTLSIELSVKKCPMVFINIIDEGILDSEVEERAVGYFELLWPNCNNIILGYLYLLRGRSIFKVKYDAVITQTVIVEDMVENTPITYRDDILIKFKYRSINYEIQFQ